MQDRYNILKEKNMGRQDQQSECSGNYESQIGISLEESLSFALDSFDNLFCRRCMVHDKSWFLLHSGHHHSV